MFSTSRERDAFFSIRGYVRQVDETILQWIELGVGQVLELERGEDIDLVSRALASENEEESERLLIQVKQREDSLTLRSSEARASIANFIEHRLKNPALALRFRFFTTARIGQERPSPLDPPTAAIRSWEDIRRSDANDPLPSVQQGWLNGIRSLLNEDTKPSDLPADTWQAYRDFVANADDETLLSLIRSFEWITDAPDSSAMRGRLIDRLIERRYASDASEAEGKYERLFLYVFTRLSARGIKRLTPEDLLAQLASPPLADSEKLVVRRVQTRLSLLESRIAALEERAENHEQHRSTCPSSRTARHGTPHCCAAACSI